MIGQRLKDLRTQRGVSLRAVAAEVGLSATLLSQLERGVCEPSLRTMRALAGFYAVPLSHLVAEDEVAGLEPGEERYTRCERCGR